MQAYPVQKLGHCAEGQLGTNQHPLTVRLTRIGLAKYTVPMKAHEQIRQVLLFLGTVASIRKLLKEIFI